MQSHLKAAETMAHILDNRFNILGFRFGVAGILDLVPELGDTLAAFLSLYLIWIAIQMRVPIEKIARMIWNIFISYIIGLIPIVGDAAYLFIRPNMRNLAILKQYAHNEIEEGVIVA